MADGRYRERDAQIWDLFCNGWNQQSLAARFNLSNQRISQIIAAFREALPPVVKEDRVLRSLTSLDWINRELHEIASSAPIPAYSNGRPILTEDPDTGEEKVAQDHSMRVTAMREMRATQESMRKMMGWDAKTETAVTVETSPEMVALVEVARARRAERQTE